MSQTNHGIVIHVVFSTKQHSPVLHDDCRDELFAYVGGTVREHKAVLLAAGGIEDHVHLRRHEIEFDERYVFDEEIAD